MNHKEITKKTYNEIANDYSNRDFLTITETFEVKDALDHFISLLKKGSTVLDVGSGGGRDSRYLFEHGMKVTGIDFSEEMIRNSRDKNSEIEYKVMDFENLDFPSNSFDGIWANASLHHIPKSDLVPVLKKLHDILKSDGVISIKVKQGSFEGIREGEKFDRVIKRHFSYYKQGEFSKIAADAGFSILSESVTNSDEWLNVVARK